MMNKVLCFLFLVSSFSLSFTQRLKASYDPVMIGNEVSTDDYDELNPLYVDEIKTLFFTRSNHPDNKFGKKDSQDIWCTELVNDSVWSEPKRLEGQINCNRYNNALAFFDGGTSVLVSGSYTKSGTWFDRGIAVFKRGEGGEWHFTRNIKVGKIKKVNDGDLFQVALSDDIMIISADKHFHGAKNELYIAERKNENKWSSLKKLKMSKFKSGKGFFAPRFSSNGDTLFFASRNDHDMNLFFVSLIDLTSKESKLEVEYFSCDSINTKHNEEFISLNDDNEIAFFSSRRCLV